MVVEATALFQITSLTAMLRVVMDHRIQPR